MSRGGWNGGLRPSTRAGAIRQYGGRTDCVDRPSTLEVHVGTPIRVAMRRNGAARPDDETPGESWSELRCAHGTGVDTIGPAR